MKAIIVLFGAILITGSYGVPTEKQVRSTIFQASEINALKRGLNAKEEREMKREQPKSPLARYHGRRGHIDTEKERNAVDMLDATRILPREEFSTQDLQHESVRSVLTRQLVACPSAPSCDFSSFIRTADGRCNNRNNPTWGMAGQPLLRRNPLVTYADQISTPRSKGVDGDDLPNPRLISNTFHTYNNTPAQEIRNREQTLHAFQFGQFLDHELIDTPVTNVNNCCSANADTDSCIPIYVTWTHDKQFPENYCINMPRSSASACGTSTFQATTVREQPNVITSYLDASSVYGSSKAEMDALRDGAFLRTVKGGKRVNVDPFLIDYHAAFVREHNRIATLLRPRIADDETLFQTVRRIIIGIMQKITYDEFLPSFMSDAAMTKYDLSSTANYTYDPTLDATISNGFGIAYRIMDEAARTLPFKSVDETTTHAFDLMALNIQRGRDHGLPPYNEFRKWCGLSSAEAWTGSVGGLVDHTTQTVDRLKQVYGSPEDIDLYPGVATEKLVVGGSIGPTLVCILGDQFNRLKYGDRFWYQGNAAGLSPNEQQAIQDYTMAKLLCETFDFTNIKAPNVFLRSNKTRSCSEIAALDMDVFNAIKLTTTDLVDQGQGRNKSMNLLATYSES